LRDYEVLYIVRPDLDDDKVQDAVKRVNTLIERSGGAIDQTSLWGKRKLAYEVKHQKEGSYVLQDFKIEPNRVPELESALKITEEVLRHLIVRKPEKPAPSTATTSTTTTAVAPPPAAVATEPARAGSSASAAEAAVGDRDREER
jgi:small subunit ribosomal protein S6